MDIADRAQVNEERERDIALAAQQAARKETPRYISGLRVCLSCEDVIAPTRLEANPDAVRCMDCQHEHERRK